MKNLVVALLVIVLLAFTPNLFAQNVSINADGSLADTSAMLDVSSTTKGFLLPRMTTGQQNAIILPATGLTIFNTTLNSIMINTGTTLSPIWSGLAAGAIDTSSIANFSVKIRSLFLGVAPITYSNGSIGITQSGSSTNGYLSSTDWNTFNNKAIAFSSGNLTETGSGVLTITGGTGSVIGSGTTVQVKQATTSQNGFLSNTDWNTFNNKLSTIDTTNITSFSTKVRGLFSSTAPITYSNGLIGITQASTSTNGYLSSTDWNTFNNKGSGNGTVTSVSVTTANGVSGTVATPTTTPAISITLGAITPTSVAATGTVTGSNLSGTNTGNVTIGTANGLSIAGQALSLGLSGTSTTGALSSLDWNTFNNKAAAFSSGNLIETGSGVLTITGGTGSVIGSGTTIQVKQANTTTNGFLSNTDWNTFNNKLSTVDTTNIASFNIKVRSLFSSTAPITYSNGLIGITQAGTSTNGYLSSTDWNTFNSKGSGNGTVTSISVTTANGVSGTVATPTTTPAISITLGAITPTSVAATGTVTGSNLSGTNTGNVTIGTANGLSIAGQALSLSLSGTLTTGALSSTDWNTFNNKAAAFSSGNLTETGSGVLTITGGTGSVIGSGTTVQVKQATTAQNGFLTSTDWNTFNNKQPQLNGTGFIKATGTTISYDNSTYLTANQTISFAPTGDVTGSTTGTTTIAPALVIGTNKVLNTMLAQMPTLTIKGNNSGVTANASDLTVAQVNAILPVFTATLNGLVPFSGGSAGKVLHGDGTWKDTASTANSWSIIGNGGTSYLTNFLGTTDNKSLRFKTNSIQGMILDSLQNVAIAASPSFSATNPEKLLVDAGTGSYNVISGKGNLNNFLQLNIKNSNSGTTASSDVVATNDAGTEANAINYVDMGINSSGYSSSGVLGGANNAYLYATGNDFIMGNATSGKSLTFFTTGSAASNERMRIDSSGNVGIGTSTPATALHVVKSNPGGSLLTMENSSASGYSSADFLNSSAALSGTFGYGNAGAGALFAGRDYFNSYTNDFLWTANSTSASLFVKGSNGNVGIGTTTPATALHVYGTNPLTLTGVQLGTNTTADSVLTINSGTVQKLPVSTFITAANTWGTSGNLGTTSTTNFIGTTDNKSFKIKTNNTQAILLDSLGNVAVGSAPAFDATNPEKFIVNAGTTSSVNAIVGKGNINNYLQLNIQNQSAGTSASSDVVATANNGNETSNYIDMGINGGSNTSGVMGVANDAYLYNIGQNFFLGTGTAAKSLIFMTGGTDSAANGRMRIDGSGNVGIATTSPAAKLDVSGTYKLGTSGSVLNNMIKASVTITDNNTIGFSTTKTISLTVTGATVGGSVMVNPRTALSAGTLIAFSRISAANTVEVGFLNGAGGTLGTITFDITVIQ